MMPWKQEQPSTKDLKKLQKKYINYRKYIKSRKKTVTTGNTLTTGKTEKYIKSRIYSDYRKIH